MVIKNCLIIIFLSITISNYSYAQNSFRVKSLEGDDCIIRVNPEYTNNKISITFNSDSICIPDFTDIVGDVQVYGRFLKITYSLKGGSGIKIRRTLLLCINNKHLYTAMHFLSEYKESLDKAYNTVADSLHLFEEYRHYSVNFYNINDNSLGLEIHDQNKSQQDSTRTYTYDTTISLKFDKNHMAFINDYEILSGDFNVNKSPSEEYKKSINGNFPILKIVDIKYYLIDGIWFEQGNHNVLFQYSYNCK